MENTNLRFNLNIDQLISTFTETNVLKHSSKCDCGIAMNRKCSRAVDCYVYECKKCLKSQAREMPENGLMSREVREARRARSRLRPEGKQAGIETDNHSHNYVD